MMAELHLLGHGELADDDESQNFGRDVEAANADWQPGEIPNVPRGYRSAAAVRRSQIRQRPVRIAARMKSTPRSREGRSTRRARSASSGRSPDDPSPGEPPPEPSPLNRVWLRALDELDSVEQYSTLAEIARIRSVWLGRWAA
jgi:hypothetical protein